MRWSCPWWDQLWTVSLVGLFRGMKCFILLSFLFLQMITYCCLALLSSHSSLNRNLLTASVNKIVRVTISYSVGKFQLMNFNVDSYSQSDKSASDLFYSEIVPFGSALSIDQFLQHEDIEALISQKLLLFDEVSDIWISLWGCNCKCLSEEEAFLTLCTVCEFGRKKLQDESLWRIHICPSKFLAQTLSTANSSTSNTIRTSLYLFVWPAHRLWDYIKVATRSHMRTKRKETRSNFRKYELYDMLYELQIKSAMIAIKLESTSRILMNS